MPQAIVVDSNEPDSCRLLLKKHGILYTVKKLETADYVIGSVGMERKTVEDFYSSMVGGRLFKSNGQCERLKNEFGIPIIVIIGSMNRLLVKHAKKSGWIISSIRKIITEYGISVVNLPTEDDFARFLLSVSRHINDVGVVSPQYSERAPALNVTARILMQIPGVGQKRATDIASKYTINDLCNLTDPSVRGVGSKTWKKIFSALEEGKV